MSRRRWIVLLGPPLLAAVATVPGLARGSGLPSEATTFLPARSITACSPVAAGAPHGAAVVVPGAWWRTEPALDAAGSLESWLLLVGAPGASVSELHIPAASTVTGPVDGRIVVASEEAPGESGSTVRIIDAVGGCATEIRIDGRVARRAVAHPDGDGVLVHLLEPVSRRDLGIWRIALDGRIAERVIEPMPDATLAAAGIDRVWATDLRLDATGGRLAVQSCHPDACVTRTVDLAAGDVETLAREGQGPIVGFSGRQLVTWAACHGFPCPIVTWDHPGRSMRTLAPDASGAALSGDGRHLVVIRRTGDDEDALVAIDVRSGATRPLGSTGRDDVPLSGAAGATSGLEVAGETVAIGHTGLVPTAMTTADAASIASPDREVQP